MRRLVSLLLTITLLMTFVVGTVMAKPKEVPPGLAKNRIFWDINGHWGQASIIQGPGRGLLCWL